MEEIGETFFLYVTNVPEVKPREATCSCCIRMTEYLTISVYVHIKVCLRNQNAGNSCYKFISN